MQLFPRVLSPDEVKVWGLPEMIPIFPTEEVLAIESKWSKEDLQKMAVDYFLSPEGDKDLLVRKLVYVGALDKDGELTGLPVGELAQQVPYVISAPRKFCCKLCNACAPENLLKIGLFLDRIAWLRNHYKVAHPGMWGKKGKQLLKEMNTGLGQVPQVQRSTLPAPFARQIRIELRKLPAWKLREAYDKLKRGEPTGTDIVERNRVHALNAIAEILWERGKLSTSELKQLS